MAGFLYLSSSEIYGDPPADRIPTPETYWGHVSSVGPRACYDESKRLAETLCTTYHRLYGLPVTIVRPFNVYGPRLRLDDGRVVPDFVLDALERRQINLLSDGRVTRSFCYVADAVAALLHMLALDGAGEAFNLGNDDEVTIADLARAVDEVSGNNLGIRYSTSADPAYLTDNPSRRSPDLTKLAAATGWRPAVGLREGIERTLTYYRAGSRRMNVAVIGSGYVGLVSAVGLAKLGHDVTAIDVDHARVAMLERGEAPFHEPGLVEALGELLAGGSFRVTGSFAAAAAADVILLCVQTPPLPSGAVELSFVEDAARTLAEALVASEPRRRVVAVRSTVPPGTNQRLLAPLLSGVDTAVASNPEFLREGSALDDFLHADRIVVGVEEPWAAEMMTDLYAPLAAPIIVTTPGTAELAKYASNAFLATLVSFSNEIGAPVRGDARRRRRGRAWDRARGQTARRRRRPSRNRLLPQGGVRLRWQLPAEGSGRPDRVRPRLWGDARVASGRRVGQPKPGRPSCRARRTIPRGPAWSSDRSPGGGVQGWNRRHARLAGGASRRRTARAGSGGGGLRPARRVRAVARCPS